MQSAPPLTFHRGVEAGRVAKTSPQGGGRQALGDRLRSHVFREDDYLNVSVPLLLCTVLGGRYALAVRRWGGGGGEGGFAFQERRRRCLLAAIAFFHAMISRVSARCV